MGLFVNNNSSAFSAFTNLTANISGLQKSMSRLSTGTKAVVDDPSGVGISERMRGQIASTAMARSNVENGLSLLQTADSWLQEIGDMVGRMHELATEAADGTKTADDQSNIQTEFLQLQDEIRRITSLSTAAAKYNGLYLFRGGNGKAVAAGDGVDSGALAIQVGPDVSQQLVIDLADLQHTNSEVIGTASRYVYDSVTHSLVMSGHANVKWMHILDPDRVSAAMPDITAKIQVAIDHIATKRASVGAQQNRLEYTRSGLLAYEDNLRAAESTVRDVDVAQESTRFAKFQILTQISNAMIAQSNQFPASALQLLG